MQLYILIVVFFVLGIGVNSFFSLSDALKKTLTDYTNRWIVYIALTAIIFLNVPQLELSIHALFPTLIAWTWLAISALVILALAKKFSFRRDITGAMLLLVPLGNTSFIGYPMVIAFFDEKVLGYAIFYDQLGSFLALSTYVVFVLAIYSDIGQVQVDDGHDEAMASLDGKNSPSFKLIATKVISSPPLICLLIALFAPVDVWLADYRAVLEFLAATLIPLALFILGLQFRPVLVPEQVIPISLSLGLKMLLAPILIWLAINHLDLPKESIQASVFQSAMPPMMTPGIMAIQANLAPRFCATILGYSAIVSMVTLPIVAYLLN